MIMMAALMFTTTSAIAQETKTDTSKCNKAMKMPRKPMDSTAKMARELDLTPEQMAKVRELNAKYPEIARHPGRPHHPHHKDMKDMKAKKDFNKFDGKKMDGKMKKMDPEKMKEVKEKYDKELKKILTKKQFKKYNELQAQKKQLRDQRPPMEPKN